MSGPTKFGFRRRSNQFDFAGHETGEPGCVDFGQWMFKAYDLEIEPCCQIWLRKMAQWLPLEITAKD